MPPDPDRAVCPEFTVALPVYNGGELVKLCVASVLSQTYEAFRLVVFDNASSDGTIEWLKTLNDPRLFVEESCQIRSIEENWARLLSLQDRGDFLTVIGHDDLLDPDFLKSMAKLIGRYPEASLYHSGFRLIDADGQQVRLASVGPAREFSHQYLAGRLRFRRDSFGTGYVFRTKDYLRVEGIPCYPKLMFADDALWLKLMNGSFKATAETVGFSYRVHHSSVSYGPEWQSTLTALQLYIALLTEIAAVDIALNRVLRECIPSYLLFWMRWACFSSGNSNARRQDLEMAMKSIFASIEPLVGAWEGEHLLVRTSNDVFGRFGRLRWHIWRAFRRLTRRRA